MLAGSSQLKRAKTKKKRWNINIHVYASREDQQALATNASLKREDPSFANGRVRVRSGQHLARSSCFEWFLFPSSGCGLRALSGFICALLSDPDIKPAFRVLGDIRPINTYKRVHQWERPRTGRCFGMSKRCHVPAPQNPCCIGKRSAIP
jgi:hypothetical protein